jgi:hypothetical protein
MTQDEIKALELEALIEDLRLNHEYCPKEVILQAADELERLSQRTEQEPKIAFNAEVVGYIAPQRSESSGKPSAWVGLTNNELQPIADEYRILFGSWVEDFARAIEAKLKEKNT